MTQWYTSSNAKRSPQYKSKSPKRKSSKRASPKRKSPSKGPGTPQILSKDLQPGAKRKGRDGHFYRVMMRSNGVNYWQKCGSKNDGGSYCRFTGPARK